MAEYSQPIAVAVSLSSDPSRWLADLFLRTTGFFKLSADPVRGFLERLTLEEPRFGKSLLLGFAALKLVFSFGDEIVESLIRLLQAGKNAGSPLAHSLADALRFYSIDFALSASDKLWVERYTGPPRIDDYPIPDKGFLPVLLLNYLRDSVGLVSEIIDPKGQKRGAFESS